jgi:hypothetical protein
VYDLKSKRFYVSNGGRFKPAFAEGYRKQTMIDLREISSSCTANNFGIMYSRKRISQNSFPTFIYIFPKIFMIFCQELQDTKRNYENQI